MSLITERAKAHYESRRELKGPILIPEWGVPAEGKKGTDGYKPAKPLEIYFRIFSLKEQSIVNEQFRKDPIKAMVQSVITRSLDADGNKLFKQVEFIEMFNHADSDIYSHIIEEFSEDSTNEDAVKN